MPNADAEILYKAETGKNVVWNEIGGFRRKSQWILDVSDETMIDIFGKTFNAEIPDTDYIEWLEQTVVELKNK